MEAQLRASLKPLNTIVLCDVREVLGLGGVLNLVPHDSEPRKLYV